MYENFINDVSMKVIETRDEFYISDNIVVDCR